MRKTRFASLIAIAALSLAGAAFAQAAPAKKAAPQPTVAQLEKQFWDCEVQAVTQGVSLGEGALCGTNYEQFKARKFGGDFNKLMAYWRAEKPAQYAKRNFYQP